MRLLLKTKEQIRKERFDLYGGTINSEMTKFGKYVNVHTETNPSSIYDYTCEAGWGYKKEWFVWDHEILKSIKKCLNQ